MFAYDMYNTKKSYKGAPSTNQLWGSQEFITYWGLGDTGSNCTVTNNITTAPDGTKTAASIVNSAAATTLIRQNVGTSAIGTGIITSSIYAKAYTGTSFTFNCYYSGDTETNIDFGLTGAGSTNTPAMSTITNVGNGWYRCTITTPARVNAGTVFSFRIWPNVRGGATAGGGCYFWGAQCEAGSYATPYIPTTSAAASRTSTNCLSDLVSTATVNTALTHNSNNTFSFNGTSDVIWCNPYEPQTYTKSIWMKATGAPSTNDAAGGVLMSSNPQLVSAMVQAHFNYSWLNQNLVMTTQDNGNSLISATNSVLQNTIYHVCAVFSGTQQLLYINGQLSTSRAWTTYPVYPTSGDRNLQIGRWGYAGYSRHFNGYIYSAALYNRALTAAEIQQNFQAHRGRYGI